MCRFVIVVIDSPEKLNESTGKRKLLSPRKELVEIWHKGIDQN
jgi:hypothetical protein